MNDMRTYDVEFRIVHDTRDDESNHIVRPVRAENEDEAVAKARAQLLIPSLWGLVRVTEIK